MIDRREILEFSRETGLAADIVEKDYVLGWLLAGIYDNRDLKNTWIFKGGTCLKKCFFETYRFSEDLDFTIGVSDQLSQQFLNNSFTQIAGWIYENCGIEIRFDAA